MADYYAHLYFGEQVLKALPKQTAQQIYREADGFILGLYGPDPLFFLNKKTRAIARKVHRAAAKYPIASLMEAALSGTPFAAGYGVGFLCHFLLDSICHPYIDAKIKEGKLNHTAIEAEFDRHMMAKCGILAEKRTPMPAMSDKVAVYAAGAVPYGISIAEYNHSVVMFRLTSGAITAANNTFIKNIVDGVGHAVPKLSALCGAVSGELPRKDAHETNRALSMLLESAIDGGVELVTEYYNALEQQQILQSPILEQNFYGVVPK